MNKQKSEYKKLRKRSGLGLCAALLAAQLAGAQTGLPLYRNYAYKDFKTNPLMWAITQDAKGVLYFANREGILQFDGYHWTLLPTPSAARSVAVDTSGRIYAGLQGDFGVFEPDKNQKLKFVSFRKNLPAADRDFSEVEDVYVSGATAYFVSRSRVFRARREANNLTSLRAFPFELLGSGFFNRELYINVSGVGLQAFQSGTPRMVPGGEVFADKEITFMQPTADHAGAYIGTAYQGVFTYKNGVIAALPTGMEAYFSSNLIYDGAVTPAGTLAVATAYGGLVLLSASGAPLKTITREGFLPANDLYSVFADHEGGVWIGHSEGVSYCLPDLSITTYDKTPGLQGKITSMTQANGILYVSTINGVYTLDPALSGAFAALPVPRSEYRTLLNVSGRVLVAGNTGVYDVTGGGATPIIANEIALALFPSKNPTMVYVALEKGLQKLLFNGAGFTPTEKIDGLTEQINSLFETEDGKLWLGTNSAGLLQKGGTGAPARYGAAQGLSDGYVGVRNVGKKPYFVTGEGVYSFDGKAFTRAEKLSTLTPNKNYQTTEDGRGGYYVYTNEGILNFKAEGNDFKVDSSSLGNFLSEKADKLYALGDVLWLGAQDKVASIKLDPRVKPNAHFRAVIRSLTLGEDSLFYQGAFWDEEGKFSQRQTKLFTPKIDHAYNSVTFTFGVSSYYNPEKTLFQYKLEGNDDKWSHWHADPRVVYTNLPGGTYTLKVRARNPVGVISEIDSFMFRIAPPWYLSYTAIFAYILGGVGLIIGSARTYARVSAQRLKAQNAKLEETIKQRTQEVEAKNVELQANNQLLETQKQDLDTAYKSLQDTQTQLIQSEKMATLGTLIAGVAHEINTPIGAVGAAATNVNKALPTVTQKLPYVFKTFSPEQEKVFFELVDRSLGFTGTLSSRDERNYRKTATEELEKLEIPNAGNLAKELVKIGVFDKLEPFKPLFVTENAPDIIDLVASIGKLRVNLDNIGIAVQKTQKIVFALKSYSYRQMDDEPAEMNIAENLETVLVVYSNQLKQGVEVVKNYDAKTVPLTWGYPDELNQVWTNLISNGIQAMESQGKLTLDVVHEKDATKDVIVVHVTDSGPGIPAHILPRIFEAFFTTKGQGEGTGLGLDISRRIVDKHQGKISVETAPGRTRFSVTIPVTKSATEFKAALAAKQAANA